MKSYVDRLSPNQREQVLRITARENRYRNIAIWVSLALVVTILGLFTPLPQYAKGEIKRFLAFTNEPEYVGHVSWSTKQLRKVFGPDGKEVDMTPQEFAKVRNKTVIWVK